MLLKKWVTRQKRERAKKVKFIQRLNTCIKPLSISERPWQDYNIDGGNNLAL